MKDDDAEAVDGCQSSVVRESLVQAGMGYVRLIDTINRDTTTAD